MASAREPESATKVCIAYVNEYLEYRRTWWETPLQKLSAVIDDKPTKRRQDCEQLIKDIEAASTPEEIIRFVTKLGRQSRETQREKADKSTVTSLAAKAAALFRVIDADPLYAKMTHAIRTRLISEVKNTDTYRLAVKERQQHVTRYEAEMAADIKKRVSSSDSEKKRDLYFNELLDMQHEDSIVHAQINHRFPDAKELPPDDWRPLKTPEGVSVQPQVPLVYSDFYYLLYLHNEIKVDQKRNDSFEKELKAVSKSEAEAEAKAKQAAEKLKAEKEAVEAKAREEAEKLKAEKEAAEAKARDEAEKLKAEKEAAEAKAREEAKRLKAEKGAAKAKPAGEAERSRSVSPSRRLHSPAMFRGGDSLPPDPAEEAWLRQRQAAAAQEEELDGEEPPRSPSPTQ